MADSLSVDELLKTYQLLSGLSPLISSISAGDFGGRGGDNKKPSVLQNMVVQSMVNPGKPIHVSMADLMNPDILGIGKPRGPVGGSAIPAAYSAAKAIPSLAGLAQIIFGKGNPTPGGGTPLGQSTIPGATPTGSPMGPPMGGGATNPYSIPGGVSVDPFVTDTPVDTSFYDSAMWDTGLGY